MPLTKNSLSLNTFANELGTAADGQVSYFVIQFGVYFEDPRGSLTAGAFHGFCVVKRQDIATLPGRDASLFEVPPLPHISSVCPDSSQVAINSPEWRGTGWEQSAFLKNITKRVWTLTFRFRVQSPESRVRGPGSRVRSVESRYVTVGFIVK